MNEWMNEWMNDRMKETMNERMNGGWLSEYNVVISLDLHPSDITMIRNISRLNWYNSKPRDEQVYD